MIDLHPLHRALLFPRCVPSISCSDHEHRILIHHSTRLQCDVGQVAGLKECPAQLCELLNRARQPAFPPHPTSLSASQDLLLPARRLAGGILPPLDSHDHQHTGLLGPFTSGIPSVSSSVLLSAH